MPAALDWIARSSAGDHAVLVYSRHKVTLRVVSSPYLSGVISDYVGGDRPTDSRSHRVNPTLSEGFRFDQDDFSLREIERDPYYQDFLRPRGLGWHACALLSASAAGDEVHLSIKRDWSRGPFTPAEFAQLQSEMSAMRSAVHFTQGAAAMMGTTADALHANGRHALFGIDSLGEAFTIVRTAGDAAVVTLRHGAICCVDPIEQPRLNLAIARARQGGQAAVILADPDGTRWSFRVRRWPPDPEVNLALVAVLSPLDYVEEPSPEWLLTARELFEFSPAEARIAALVGQGLSVPVIAKRLALQPGTVRNQLKAVFAKTGAVRQTELAVLLSRL